MWSVCGRSSPVIQAPGVFLAGSCRGSRTPLSAQVDRSGFVSGDMPRVEVEGCPSARPIRGIPHLLEASLLMMPLTGMMAFRSLLCWRTRDDCADTGMKSSRIMNNSWLAHSRLEGGDVKKTKGYQAWHVPQQTEF